MFKREPDFIVGGKENPYLLRWWVIPRNRFFNIYLHKFLRDDDDRALHDHPWWSLSIILRGGYLEHLPGGRVKHRRPGRFVLRNATAAHRVELLRQHQGAVCWRGRLIPPYSLTRPAWTIFITGPRIREWGFHCPQGWRHWKDFTKAGSPGEIGPGCE